MLQFKQHILKFEEHTFRVMEFFLVEEVVKAKAKIGFSNYKVCGDCHLMEVIEESRMSKTRNVGREEGK